MKKSIKRILSFALVSAMALSMAVTASASEYSKTYTLYNGETVTFSDVISVEEKTITYFDALYEMDITEYATFICVPEGATFTTSSDFRGDWYFGYFGSTGLDSFYGGALDYDVETDTYSSLPEEAMRVTSPISQEDFETPVFSSSPLSVDYVQLSDIHDETYTSHTTVYIYMQSANGEVADVVENEEVITAAPTDSTVLVDGENASFEAYNIADNNYFKLRDIAQILSGTEAQFEVTWDGEKQAINMMTGEAYTAVGGELATGDGTAKEYVANTSTIYLNGEEVSLTAYTINDNNYFKLRDLGEAIGFNVSWDNDTRTIVIASDEAYTAD